MKYCSVKGCKSTNLSEGKVLHTFKKEWMGLCEWKSEKPNRICSDHFRAGCYKKGKKKLLDNAKPSQFISKNENHSLIDHNYALPSASELSSRLQEMEKKVEDTAKKLYKANCEKRKLEQKIEDLQAVLEECRQKFDLDEDTIDILKKAGSSVPRDLLTRTVKKIKTGNTSHYSPAMRKFALTLHLQSPAAYR